MIKIKFLKGEDWKLIRSLEGINNRHYAVSTRGRIIAYEKKISEGTILQLNESTADYLCFRIKTKKRTGSKTINVHQVMADCFLSPSAGKDFIIHKDYDKKNNLLTNLKCVTIKESNEHFFNDPERQFSEKSKIKNQKGEEWRLIKSLEQYASRRHYAISNYGRVMSFKNKFDDGQILKQQTEPSGFILSVIPIVIKGKSKTISLMINREVAKHFLPPHDKNLTRVLHKDLNKSNNHVSNLYWASHSEVLRRNAPKWQWKFKAKPFRIFVNEEWRHAKSVDGIGNLHYSVSNFGRLASWQESFEKGARQRKGTLLKGQKILQIDNKKKGTSRAFSLHLLIAECFLPPRKKEDEFLIHIDYDKLNNVPSNLKWVDAAGLEAHSKKSPKYLAYLPNNKGGLGRGHKLTESKVRLLKKILARPNRKTRLKMIAKQFDIAPSTLYNIRIGKLWKQVVI